MTKRKMINRHVARARDKWALEHLKKMNDLGCVTASRKLKEMAESEGKDFEFNGSFVANARRRHGLSRVNITIEKESINSNISQDWLSKPMR